MRFCKASRLLLIVSAALALAGASVMAGCGGAGDSSSGAGESITVLSTNDRHSQYLDTPYNPANPAELSAGSRGGLARVATIFSDARAANGDVLVVDAGDFSDGTAFIAAEDGAADLNILTALGYDAACIGNHEMSLGPAGLAQMINNAEKDAQGKMVPLLCANIHFSATDATDDTLEALYGNEGDPGKYVFPWIVRTLPSGKKVGLFGLMGGNVFMPDAMPCTFPVVYTDVQAIVDTLRTTQGVDAVICVAHAGFSAPGGVASGELATLAKNVSGIDLIAAGHSHSQATAMVACEVSGANWKTAIMEADDGAKYVGEAKLRPEKDGTDSSRADLDILAVDDTVAGDAGIAARIAGLITDVETDYLTEFSTLASGGLFDVLAHASFTYGQLNGMYMVSDAMRSVSGAGVALVTPGADTAWARPDANGDITVYGAYASMSHSMGRDGLHGGALYKVNFLAAEIQGILELGTCNMGQASPDLFVVPSGIRIVCDTTDLRAGTGPGYIIKMYIVSADEGTETLVFDRSDPAGFPYGGWKSAPGTTAVAGDPYQMLSVSTTLITLVGLKYVSDSDGPGGDINLWPRTAAGSPVEWTAISQLDTFRVTSGGDEVKAWYAVAQYISGLGGTLPARYDDTYTDGSTGNPVGPAWRRVWDLAEHAAP
ncbi:MAG: bifunctional metallophosphatase/5'-nucleotidase [Spirochaetes bacterium]|nr:MAG: bifunctional metallophosphatase/5'-nucleotidase [Spirochaetota bacterium]